MAVKRKKKQPTLVKSLPPKDLWISNRLTEAEVIIGALMKKAIFMVSPGECECTKEALCEHHARILDELKKAQNAILRAKGLINRKVL